MGLSSTSKLPAKGSIRKSEGQDFFAALRAVEQVLLQVRHNGEQLYTEQQKQKQKQMPVSKTAKYCPRAEKRARGEEREGIKRGE